jgi:hypothetical protein
MVSGLSWTGDALLAEHVTMGLERLIRYYRGHMTTADLISIIIRNASGRWSEFLDLDCQGRGDLSLCGSHIEQNVREMRDDGRLEQGFANDAG